MSFLDAVLLEDDVYYSFVVALVFLDDVASVGLLLHHPVECCHFAVVVALLLMRVCQNSRSLESRFFVPSSFSMVYRTLRILTSPFPETLTASLFRSSWSHF